MTQFALPAGLSPDALRGVLARSRTARYLAALGLVMISLTLRMTVAPAMAPGFSGYTCFYPAVILAAYWLGSRPAMAAAVVSAAIVYGLLGPTPFVIRTESAPLISLTFFLMSSSLLIYVLSAIRSRLDDLTRNHKRVEALVFSHAELFRDHATRVSNHMQLVSAILQHCARAEADERVSQALTNAASRTLLISRTHRSFADDGERTIGFEPFVRKLVEAAAADGGIAAGRVAIEGDNLDVPLEHASAIGLILLDHLNALGGDASTTLRIRLVDEADDRALTLIATGAAATLSCGDALLLESVTEQLRGRLLITDGDRTRGVRLAFPAALQPPPEWRPLAFNLH